jgi:hypothetical protein
METIELRIVGADCKDGHAGVRVGGMVLVVSPDPLSGRLRCIQDGTERLFRPSQVAPENDAARALIARFPVCVECDGQGWIETGKDVPETCHACFDLFLTSPATKAGR